MVQKRDMATFRQLGDVNASSTADAVEMRIALQRNLNVKSSVTVLLSATRMKLISLHEVIQACTFV